MSPSQSPSGGGGGRHKDKDGDVGRWGDGIKTHTGEKKELEEGDGELVSWGEGGVQGRTATHSGINSKSASCHSANADT